MGLFIQLGQGMIWILDGGPILREQVFGGQLDARFEEDGPRCLQDSGLWMVALLFTRTEIQGRSSFDNSDFNLE